MAGTVKFTRDYAAFGNQVKPHEKSDDVGIVVTQFLWFQEYPYYPIGDLVNAKISAIWLGEGEKPAGEVNNIDLIFKMAGFGEGLFEIVLRSEGAAVYGGYVFGESLDVTDEIVNGHRVLVTTSGAEKLRFVYTIFDDPETPPQYAFEVPAAGAALSTTAARRAHKRPRR